MTVYDDLDVSAWISGVNSCPFIGAKNAWSKISRKTFSTLKTSTKRQPHSAPMWTEIPHSTVQQSLGNPDPGNQDPPVVRTILGQR
jgi:hypothetical protein